MALLEARGVTKHFGSVPAVDQVDLDLVEGESVGLIGPNGAGKTTLLSLLAGYHRPTLGAITLEGKDILPLPVHARVIAGISRAAQIPQTFVRLTVRENILLPASFGARLAGNEATDWVAEVLSFCGLAEKAETPAGSLGLLDRKRLELAKAVAARPKILLLDEVAAGLTEPEIESMKEIIAQLQPGRAIVWVEHIPFALQGICRRLVVMDKGAKTLDGPFDEVWNDPGMQSTYMGVTGDTGTEH